MRLYYIKDNVDLKELCINFKETEKTFELDGPFNEFIIINKESRRIQQSGYNGLLKDYLTNGYAEVRIKEMYK